METKEDWRILIEKQIYPNLESLFLKAELSSEEKDIFIKYKKHCSFWLLRSKIGYAMVNNLGDTNFIKRLARVLINLQSENVTGRKEKFVKDMFSNKSMHKFTNTKNGGFHITQYSPLIENTYFELEILSFFLKAGYKVELAKNNIKNKKIPEFTVHKPDISIEVEAKKLDADKILDNIFITKPGSSGYHSNLAKNRDQLKQRYDSAINKFDNSNYFLIFISTVISFEQMGPETIYFVNSLQDTWIEKNYNKLIGVVFKQNMKTTFIKNQLIDERVINEINNIEINNFHNFCP